MSVDPVRRYLDAHKAMRAATEHATELTQMLFGAAVRLKEWPQVKIDSSDPVQVANQFGLVELPSKDELVGALVRCKVASNTVAAIWETLSEDDRAELSELNRPKARRPQD